MPIDIDRILIELDYVLPKHDTQISLQGVEGQTDPFYGTGKITDIAEHTETDFIYPIFSELTYTNQVLEQLNVYRARVMRMKPKTCYSYHRDYTRRLHIPLITNNKCFFIIDDEVFRYPADGNFYIADTQKLHTFVNASFEERIHIVGCISDKWKMSHRESYFYL